MKKIITISVYGDDEKYCLGALRNIELAKELYPGWFVKIFYDKTVPEKYVTMYSNNDNVILEDMTSKKIPGMFWRFMCFDDKDIEVFIVRDADSRLLKREVEAVNDWLSKNKALHIIWSPKPR